MDEDGTSQSSALTENKEGKLVKKRKVKQEDAEDAKQSARCEFVIVLLLSIF